MKSVEEAHQEIAANAEALRAERMMAYFQYGHLPEKLQSVSKPFCELAVWIVSELPQNPERTVALRKLLEAKDCAVRALL
jgi:ferritin-like protein